MHAAWIVVPHVLVGAVVLALYWRTILSRKGGPAHRRWGKLYLLALTPLLASVAPLLLGSGDPARLAELLFLALVVATAGWTAWRAVRDRRTPERFRGRVFRTLAAAMAGCGVGLMTLGVLKGDVLTVGFASIGIVYGGAMLGALGRALPADWWLSWHLNGVALLFAATHASFVSLLARSAMPEFAGEPMHALTQLGTIAFAYGFRQWLGHRFATLGGAVSVARERPVAASAG